MKKIILHCDLNNFYASVECIKQKNLKGKPVAVGGNEKTRHGIILAKNEIAKAQGVKTAETIWSARQKCKGLVIVPPDFEMYRKYSVAVRKIYEKYTNYVESYGLDECYLDVTELSNDINSAYDIAYRIKEEIKRKLGLTISVGVSFNKDFAKLGSDLKKPDAITVISEENFRDIVWSCPVNFLMGVGHKMNEKLAHLGIKTIGDLANFDMTYISRKFGKHGYGIWQSANGNGSACISHKDSEYIPKSIGHGVTLPKDIILEKDVKSTMIELSNKIEKRLEKYDLYGKCIKISIKDNDFITKDIQQTLEKEVRKSKDIYDGAIKIFRKHYKIVKPIRTITISVTTIKKEEILKQMSIFDLNTEINNKKIDNTINLINEKYGKNKVMYASEL